MNSSASTHAACLLILLCLVGCTPARQPGGAANAPATFRLVGSRRAEGSTIALSVKVSQAAATPRRLRAEVSIAGLGAEGSDAPTAIRAPSGSEARVLVVSASESSVAFDSFQADKSALASQTRPFTPPGDTATIEPGEQHSKTYEFTVVRPGKYVVVANTVDPRLETAPIEITVP